MDMGHDNHQVEEEQVARNVEHEDEDVMEVENVEEDESSDSEDSDDDDNPNNEDPPPHNLPQDDDLDDLGYQLDENGLLELEAFDLLWADVSDERMEGPLTSKVFLKIYRFLLESFLRFKSKVECILSIDHRNVEDVSIEDLMKEYEAEESSDVPVTPKMFIHLYGFYLKLIAKMESYVVGEEVARADLKAMEEIVQDISSGEGEGMKGQLTGRMFVRVVKLIFGALGRVNEGMDNLEKAQNNKARIPWHDQTGITYNWPLDDVKNFEAQEEHLKKLKEKNSKEIQASSPSNDSSGHEYETLIEYITSQQRYFDTSVEGMISKILNGMFEVDLQQNFVFLDVSLRKQGIQIRFEGTQTCGLVTDCISSKHAGIDINFIRTNIQKWWAHKKDRLRNLDDDDEDSD